MTSGSRACVMTSGNLHCVVLLDAPDIKTGTTQRPVDGHLLAQPLSVCTLALCNVFIHRTRKRTAGLMVEQSEDMSAFLRGRFEREDTSTVGFYERSSRTFRTVSQHEFLDQAAGTADQLDAAGVQSGDYLAVVAASPEMLWRGLLGSILAGAVPLLTPIRTSLDGEADIERKLDDIARAVPGVRFMVQYGPQGPCVAAPGDVVRFDRDQPPGDALARLRELEGDPDRVLHLQLTSGSTGDVKPVVLTHRSVLASLRSLNERIEAQPGDHVVSWLPLYHDMGLIGMAMLSLISGANLRLLSPFDFLADPTHWLEAISQSPGAITAAPNFALDYSTRRVTAEGMKRLDLGSWRKCYCGAEPVDSVTVAAFIERFTAAGLGPDVVHPTYGLAEATLMVTMPHSGDLPKQLTITKDSIATSGPVTVVASARMSQVDELQAALPKVACLGPIAVDLEVEIIDGDGATVVGEDFCGEVVVSGPPVAAGYLQPDGSLQAFADNRCHTGDVGFFHGGELYLVERLKNIIISNGENHSAGALERLLAERTDLPLDNCVVLQRTVVGSNGAVVAVLELPRGRGADDLLEAARATVRAEDLPIEEVMIVRRGTVPRTTSGKKQHAKLRLMLADTHITPLARGSWATTAAPDDEEVIDLDRLSETAVVVSIIERHAARRGWNGRHVEESNLLVGDLGLDSLALIEISIDVESTIGHGIAEEHLGGLVTVGDVVEMITDKSLPSVRLSSVLQRLIDEVPQVYRRVTEQRGRQVLIDGRWITDFASLNYLGLDLCSEVIESVPAALQEWGAHPSWTRAVASPQPYYDLERELAELCGAPDVMAFSTITLLHFGVLPKLATASDSLIVDAGAHNSIHEAAELAAARGAALFTFDHRDINSLEDALRAARGRPIVALNGVYSMTGAVADLRAIHDLTVAHGGLLYLDDAHGFGILGEQPTADCPYGVGGGGVVRHLGLSYEHVVYVAGLSKAFSSMAAFITCRDHDDRSLFETASTSIFSGPIPVASMATALAGLAVNRSEGDARRQTIHDLTDRLIEGALRRGYQIDNELTFPVVNLQTGGVERTIRASQIMWEHGILFTPSVFPAAPLDRGGLRVSLTADNTPAEVDQLLRALDAVAFELGAPPAVTHHKMLLPAQ
ncbi:MAG: 8-amino-7-oxononanoate synthase [Candidatus Poriferisodalaceae bacterium]